MHSHLQEIVANAYEQPSSNAVSPADVLLTLEEWETRRIELAFGHYRLRDGVVQTGSAKVRNVGERHLTLRARGTSMTLDVAGARYERGRLGLIEAPDFRQVLDVDGISVFPKNRDWLFLCVKPADIGFAKLRSLLRAPIRYEPLAS
jgi:hypothetical protein